MSGGTPEAAEGVAWSLPLDGELARLAEERRAAGTALDVAVLDDHLPVREGLVPLLAREAIDVVVAAPVTAAGLGLILDLEPRPAIALVGVGSAGRGLALAQRVATEATGTATLLMTEGAEDIDASAALAAGAAGVLWKGSPLAIWAEGVRAVAEGRLWLEPAGPPAAERPGHTRLSERERRVLVELARGCTTEEAAASLHVSPHTIRTHVRNIQRKLGARTRVHALALALSSGEIDPL